MQTLKTHSQWHKKWKRTKSWAARAQIIIPKEQRELASIEGISTDVKQKVALRILNLTTGESYAGRLASSSGRARIQLL